MKPFGALAFALVMALCGCGKPEQLVMLDREWNADSAKSACTDANRWHRENAALVSRFGCDRIMSCNAMTLIVNACVSDPVQQVREFEAALATQFAAIAECKSVKLMNPASPRESNEDRSDPANKVHWSLGLDFSPGAQKQQWTMIHSRDQTAFTQGEGDPNEIAVKVCASVRQAGAS